MVDVLANDRLGARQVVERRKITGQQRRREVLQFEKHGREFFVDALVRHRRQQQVLAAQHQADFVEGRRAQRLDAPGHVGRRQLCAGDPVCQGHVNSGVKQQPPVFGQRPSANHRQQGFRFGAGDQDQAVG